MTQYTRLTHQRWWRSWQKWERWWSVSGSRCRPVIKNSTSPTCRNQQDKCYLQHKRQHCRPQSTAERSASFLSTYKLWNWKFQWFDRLNDPSIYTNSSNRQLNMFCGSLLTQLPNCKLEVRDTCPNRTIIFVDANLLNLQKSSTDVTVPSFSIRVHSFAVRNVNNSAPVVRLTSFIWTIKVTLDRKARRASGKNSYKRSVR